MAARKNPSAKPGRREKALATRRRMLKAASDVFCARGFGATTMEQIASEAGVAVQTLYFTFHNKGALLNEAIGASIMGFDAWDPALAVAVEADARKAFAEHHAWFAAFARARTTAEAIAIMVSESVDILQRVAPLARVMSEAAGADPAVKRNAEVAEQRRVDGFTLVAEQLAKRGELRRGVSARRVADMLLTLLGPEPYLSLTTARRWSHAETKRWLIDVLTQQMLD